METSDFPALFQAADAAAIKAQKDLLNAYRINSGMLIVASVVSMTGTSSKVWVSVSAILFIASLASYVWSQVNDLQGRWYAARALAESVKTATWRYLMNADPFSKADSNSNDLVFRNLLKELLKQNEKISNELSGTATAADQITTIMRDTLKMRFADKQSLYLKERIASQRKWYQNKASACKRASSICSTIVYLLYSGAIVFTVVKIGNPELTSLPIDVFAVAASVAIGWRQLRRYSELVSAYTLTALEVGIIESQFHSVTSAGALASFVADSENAFSREHTQWAARRDHG